jgi:hypothetical protein
MANAFANLGLSACGSARPFTMVGLGVLNVISIALLCVSLSGATTTTTILKDTAWALTYYDDTIVEWIGLKQLTIKDGGNYLWDDCYSTIGNNYCDTCNTSGQTALSTTGIAFALSFLTIVVSFLRFRGDNTVFKLLGFLAPTVGWFCLVIAMADFDIECVNKIKSAFHSADDDYVKDATFKLGPGFNCAIAAFFILLVSCLVHLLTPVTNNNGNAGMAANRV